MLHGMKLLIATTAALVAASTVASAEPSADDLSARAADLIKRLAGKGYTVVVEAPFVVVGDDAPATVRHQAAGFLRWTVGLLEKDFFPKRPDKLIEVWLFKNEKTYRAGAKAQFGDDPDTPYGYYSPAHVAMIMNMGPGAGTLSHELVHPYVEANFPDAPSWFNEGLASLYERPTEVHGHIQGLPNWRLPNLKKEIKDGTLPSLKTLMTTTHDGFYSTSYDGYAYARYLMEYLQDKGQLHAFYERFNGDKDTTGQAALAAIVGEELTTFEPKWRAWVLALKGDNR
jgi:hypothetical protein